MSAMSPASRVAPSVQTAYDLARERFAALGVDAEAALARLDAVAVSMHCWQGDDVRGFENPTGALTGGIQVSGNYPGRARSPDELRADLDLAMSLIPGPKRLNLHAIYLEAAEKVERDAIEPKHFANWVAWAKAKGIGLDFNPTCFSHPLSADGWTLSHPDAGIRRFWIDHCKASRRVSESFGRALGTPSVMNIWVPDGAKDFPADRYAPRARLRDALDEVIAEKIDKAFHKDAVESKLFGIGAEAYTVGSNEFYLAYAATRGTMLCLDAGHFHPTESVADKLSAVLGYLDEVLLHVSRPMRWDSDHVVLLDDETSAIAAELVRGDVLPRVAIGLDFFDASINRVAAWVIGTRNMKKALLKAMLEPRAQLLAAEAEGDGARRMALFEEHKSAPWGAVWDYYCARGGVPVGGDWFQVVKSYERDVLAKRETA
jgi:L-rhamnose isomerase